MMWNRIALVSLVGLCVTCTVVVGQDASTDAKPDPTGTWKWEREFNETTIDYVLTLKWKDEKLTGTYKTIFENGPPGLSEPVDIEDGEFDGKKLSFSVTRSFNDNEFSIAYDGELSGDKITGKSTVDFGNGPREFDWTAERSLAVDDVVGTWKIKFETPNGAVEPSFTITRDGETLKGTYHSTFFGENPIKDIQVNNQGLSFAVTFDTDNGDFTVNYQAKPRGDKIDGVISANFGGQNTETPFAGTRAAMESSEPNDDKS